MLPSGSSPRRLPSHILELRLVGMYFLELDLRLLSFNGISKTEMRLIWHAAVIFLPAGQLVWMVNE